MTTIFINSKQENVLMKSKFILLSIFFIFVFAAGVSALIEDPTYTFKQNTASILRYPCFINGTWCSTSAVCNITITFSDGTLIADNKFTENHYTYHSYNLTKGNTSGIGYYKTDMACCDAGYCGDKTFYYQITPTGSGNVRQDYFLPLALFIVALIMLVIAIYMKNEYLGFISGMLMVITGVYIMIKGFGDFSDTYTQMIAYVIIGIGILIFVAAAYEAINSNRITLFNNSEGDED